MSSRRLAGLELRTSDAIPPGVALLTNGREGVLLVGLELPELRAVLPSPPPAAGDPPTQAGPAAPGAQPRPPRG